MFSIPQISQPLAKAIRTSEGILVFATSAVIAAGSAIEPGKLPPKDAAYVAAGLAVAHVVSRTLLKVTAVQGKVGVGAPIPVDPFPVADASELAASVETFVSSGFGKALLDRLESGVKPDIPAPGA